MSQTYKMRCIVRNCHKPAPKIICRECFQMLATGVIDPTSPAWFVTEITFLNTQNDAAMKEVNQLHSKVNELTRDGK